MGIAWYGKQYVRDLNSGNNLGGGNNNLSNKLSADGSLEENNSSTERESVSSNYATSPSVTSGGYQGSYQSSL